jgi:hypothetical protein
MVLGMVEVLLIMTFVSEGSSKSHFVSITIFFSPPFFSPLPFIQLSISSIIVTLETT